MNIEVKTILKQVKANNTTYKNVELGDVIKFQDLYSYLKKHSDKRFFNAVHNSYKHHLNNKKYFSDYLRKYKAMECIAYSIKH
jgi:hypothetical protein